MKFESINSSKFNNFQENQILNTLNVVGGRPTCTKKGGEIDCWDDATGKDITCEDGSSYDICSSVATDVGSSSANA